jgi:hypothetical protein
MNVSKKRPTWRSILDEQGRTLTWLGLRTGVSRATVYAYSQGQRRPPEAWLAKAADALGVPVALMHPQPDAQSSEVA